MKRNAGSDRAVAVINSLTHTSGPYAGQPFNLRPWQEKEIVRPLFRTKADGQRQYRTCLLMLPRKNGKALALDTSIPTPHGWATMRELSVGDIVFRPDGTPTPVLATTAVQHERSCYAVTFSDGERIVADAEHEWVMFDRYRERDVLVTTGQMSESWRIGNRKTHREHRYSVTTCKPLQATDRVLPIAPYVLGAWLGDGHTGQASITTVDVEILDNVAACGERITTYPSGRISYRIGAALHRNRNREATLHSRLRRAGLLGNKHIPRAYLRASVSQRLALLQGLMDTDGAVCFSGPLKTPQCEYSTTKESLRDGVLELVRSLGLKPQVMTCRARLNGKDCGEAYRIIFTAWQDMPVFKLARKLDRLRIKPTTQARSMTRQVVGVEAVASVPVKCIQVEGGMYLAGRSMVPTHNSELAAAIAIYGLLFDGVQGGQVYSCAADKDQAALVFNVAAQMIRNDPELEAQVEIIDSQKRIVHPKSGTFYRAISAEAYSKHGFSAHLVLYDELHCAPTRELWDVMASSQGAHASPQMIAISTAGYDRHSVLFELYQHAKKVQETPEIDPTFLSIIYEMPKDADWTDEREWTKCNPALGDFRSLEDMRIACARAKEIPAQENAFRRLFGNQWTEQSERWIQMEKWDQCKDTIDERALEGADCIVGLDLANTTDIAAAVLLFPRPDGRLFVLPRFWVPADGILKRSQTDRVPYELWAREGFLTPTPGNVIDYAYIRAELNALKQRFAIREIGFDPWNAEGIRQQLETDGFQTVKVPQTVSYLNEATKRLGDAIVNRTLVHDGHPVLRWMASNMVVRLDANANLRPDKAKSSEKIDGIVATIIALSVWLRQAPVKDPEYQVLVYGGGR